MNSFYDVARRFELQPKMIELQRPKTATVGLAHTDRQTATFALHQGVPYKVVAWEGSTARCIEATHEEVDALQRRLAELGLLDHFLPRHKSSPVYINERMGNIYLR